VSTADNLHTGALKSFDDIGLVQASVAFWRTC